MHYFRSFSYCAMLGKNPYLHKVPQLHTHIIVHTFTHSRILNGILRFIHTFTCSHYLNGILTYSFTHSLIHTYSIGYSQSFTHSPIHTNSMVHLQSHSHIHSSTLIQLRTHSHSHIPPPSYPGQLVSHSATHSFPKQLPRVTAIPNNTATPIDGQRIKFF